MGISGDFSTLENGIVNIMATELMRNAGISEVASLMTAIMEMAEDESLRSVSPGESSPIACAAGCSACCVLNVSVLWPEAVAIAWYLKLFFHERVVSLIRLRMEQVRDRIQWVDDEERIRLGIPCAFLDSNGRCIVHPVRPLLCRSVTSTDAEQCKKVIAASSSGEDEEPVIMNLTHKYLMETVFRQVAQALEKQGMDNRNRELTAAVLEVLNTPNSPAQFMKASTAAARDAGGSSSGE